jgi:deoxyribonuclease-4
MAIKFGPSGLGPVNTAIETLEKYHEMGLRACEIAFTYGVYIKDREDAIKIGKHAKKLGIDLSIHAPYFVNLNSEDKAKREATKRRILSCCRVGELMKAKLVVFHPGFYGKNRENAKYQIIQGIKEIRKEMKKNKWKIKIAPETMGKINVFGSPEEIAELVKETGCSYCLDFAHILAREKKVDMNKIKNLFPEKNWHIHFSGIIYGEKGEQKHRDTRPDEWKKLIKSLPKKKNIRIICEAPNPSKDAKEGLEIYSLM